SAVELLLFDCPQDAEPGRVICLDARTHRTYHYWHAFVPGLRAGQTYAYRAVGPAEHCSASQNDAGTAYHGCPRRAHSEEGHLRRRVKVLALCGILFLPLPAAAQWPQEDEGTFEGFWAMSGTMHVLELPDREMVGGGGLTGTITVQTSQGPVPSFETDCVVFSDTRSKGVGRCVWTATTGDLVLVDLES